ncbi:MAG TPA: HEAT repeat domain-containing protein [Pyrinomonadaceae bacterium]|nr:HEAT repeat domain-containing protein [Pyrinomonadaceae bacterium]
MNRNTATSPRRPSLQLVAGLLAGVVLGATILSTGLAQQQDTDKLSRFVQTQNLPAAQLFREGRDLIGDEDWNQAEDKFRRFVQLYQKDANFDAALYWLAFTLSKQEKYGEAGKHLSRLLADFPRSNWADDARALRAQIAGEEGNQKVINQGLNEEDVEVKIVALESLFQSNPERGLAYVADMLKPGSKASPRLREAGVEMLRRHGGPRATALLLDVIRNQTDRQLRVVAIQALGRTGDESVLPLLKELAETSTDDEVSKAAVFAISRFEGAGARGLLLELARSGKSVEVRKDAIFWLSQGGDAAMDELMRIYEADRNTEVRKQIVFALKRMGTPRSAAKLQEIARGSDDVEVRKDALHWIGQSGGAQSVEFLIQTYDTEKDDEVKKQVVFALSRTDDKRALRKLMDIARRDPSVEMRKQAIFWLGRSSDPEAQKFLEDILN